MKSEFKDNINLSHKNKINFLIKEKEIARKEIFLYLKTINTMYFYFFTVIGAFLGFKFSNINFGMLTNNIILLIFGQIAFLFLLHNLNLQGGISCLAGYIRSIEDKINILSNDSLCCWESKIVPEYMFKRSIKKMSSVFISSNFIALILFICFLIYPLFLNEFFCIHLFILLTIHIFELLILVLTAFLTVRDKENSYVISKSLNINK
jgi:hypothetical protein